MSVLFSEPIAASSLLFGVYAYVCMYVCMYVCIYVSCVHAYHTWIYHTYVHTHTHTMCTCVPRTHHIHIIVQLTEHNALEKSLEDFLLDKSIILDHYVPVPVGMICQVVTVWMSGMYVCTYSGRNVCVCNVCVISCTCTYIRTASMQLPKPVQNIYAQNLPSARSEDSKHWLDMNLNDHQPRAHTHRAPVQNTIFASKKIQYTLYHISTLHDLHPTALTRTQHRSMTPTQPPNPTYTKITKKQKRTHT